MFVFSVDMMWHQQSAAAVNLTSGRTRGHRKWTSCKIVLLSYQEAHSFAPFCLSHLALLSPPPPFFFFFLLSLRRDSPLKTVWGTVWALVSKHPCHLACWLWAGPYPASMSLHFQSQAMWGRIRERERARELDGGKALWKISQILLTHGYSWSEGLWAKCAESASISALRLSGTICWDVCHQIFVWW